MSSHANPGAPRYFTEAPETFVAFGDPYTIWPSGRFYVVQKSGQNGYCNSRAIRTILGLDMRTWNDSPVAKIRSLACLYYGCHTSATHGDWPEFQDTTAHCRLINFIVSAEHLMSLVKHD